MPQFYNDPSKQLTAGLSKNLSTGESGMLKSANLGSNQFRFNPQVFMHNAPAVDHSPRNSFDDKNAGSATNKSDFMKNFSLKGRAISQQPQD